MNSYFLQYFGRWDVVACFGFSMLRCVFVCMYVNKHQNKEQKKRKKLELLEIF